MKNNTMRRLDKQDIPQILAIIIIFHLIEIGLSKFNDFTIYVSLIAILVSVLIVFLKTFKHIVTEKTVNQIWGIIGVFNAFIFTLLFAFSFNVSFVTSLIIFGVASAIVVVVILSMRILYIRVSKKTTSQENKAVSTIIISICSVLGAGGGIYLARTGIVSGRVIETLYLGFMVFVLTIFSLFVFKSKDCR